MLPFPCQTELRDLSRERVYAQATVEHGWSRPVLLHQSETGLHDRQGRAITNFSRVLPPAESDLAQQMLMDPYQFDFLSLAEDA